MSPRRRRSVSPDRRSNSRRRRSPSPERHFKDDKSRRSDRRRRSPSPDRRRRSPSVDEKMDRSRRRDDSPRRGSREKREVSPPTPKGRQESTPPPGADEVRIALNRGTKADYVHRGRDCSKRRF